MPVSTEQTVFELSNLAFNFGIKTILLLIVFVYSIFSILVIRQVKTMERTITTPLSATITTIAILHSLSAIILLFSIIFFL